MRLACERIDEITLGNLASYAETASQKQFSLYRTHIQYIQKIQVGVKVVLLAQMKVVNIRE